MFTNNLLKDEKNAFCSMKHDRIPVMLIAVMFLTIGVMFCMNDILLPIVKESFQLSYLQATFIQISFYIVYIIWPVLITASVERSEEHTSELQSRLHLVCRLLLEKKKPKC